MEHTLTITPVPHTCGGYETQVRCSCGYVGTKARIFFNCPDSAPRRDNLDAVHAPLLEAAEQAPPPARTHQY